MAESVDNYKDLDELTSCEKNDDDLENSFTKAANHVQSLITNVDNKTLLCLYGYYKQATEGSCNIPKPSWFDLKAKSKWEAWHSLGNMPQRQARTSYIEMVNKLDPNFVKSETNSTNLTQGWVTVSVLKHDPEEDLDDSDKSLIDFVKDCNIDRATAVLDECDRNTLKKIINHIDEDGLNLLHWAADRGSVEMLSLLLSYGAEVNILDADNQTPLHYAVSCGHTHCVKVLLENGADVTIKDADGNDVLALAPDDSVHNLLISKFDNL